MLDLGIAAFGNDLVAAWRGFGSDQGLYYSSFDGSSWAPQATIPGAGSSVGPALCEFNGRLYAAWKGSGTDEQLYYSSFDGSSWAPQATIPGVASSIGPALAGFGNKLYAAWKGSGTNEQLWYTSFDGSSWAPQATIPGVASSIGPTLRVGFGGRLYAAWKGSDTNDQLWYTSFDGSSWAPQATIPGTDGSSGSLVGASLAGFDNKLYAAWRTTANNAGQLQLDYSSFDGSSWASPAVIPGTVRTQPISLHTVVDSGAMLNVGDANLFNLSWDVIFNQATSAGVSADSTKQGSWFTEAAECPGGNTVTVNAHIEADWGSGPGWNWWDLQDAFASTLWAVMQAVSNPTGYENYSRDMVVDDVAPVICEPGEFVDWGHYIPAQIIIHAHDNVTGGNDAGSVTVTYSTGDQSGENACDIVGELGSVLAIFPPASELAAIVGAGTALLCG